MTLNEADVARKAGQYRKALDLYRSVLSETPETTSAYEGLAVCLSNLKDYAGALRSANHALELDSSLVIPHAVMADVYHHQKKFDQAEAEIRKAVELQPNSSRAFYVQGVSYLWKNEFNDAIISFEKAIELEPDLSATYGSHANLGYIYHRRREFKKALQEYQSAYNLRSSRKLLFSIRLIKYRWVISIVVTILLFSLFPLGVIFDSGLLLALFFLPPFLASVGLVVRYIKQKKVFWMFVTASISIFFGWLIYRILYMYFTK